MARLTDLPPAVAKRYAELECPTFATTPWVTGPPLAERRVAIVSSAGLVVRGQKPFRGRDADYRVIPSETRPDQLMFSHISINLDRSGFQEDWNVVFPLDRLRELGARRGGHRGLPGKRSPRTARSPVASALCETRPQWRLGNAARRRARRRKCSDRRRISARCQRAEAHDRRAQRALGRRGRSLYGR